MKRIIYVFTVLTFLCGCVEKKKENIKSDKDLHDLVKIFINEQGLNLNYGLRLEPEPNFDTYKSDNDNFTEFINQLEPKEIGEQAKEIREQTDFSLLEAKLDAQSLMTGLTKEDVLEMVEQKKSLKSFKWNIDRLGFDSSNKENWYSFSVPLFSKDQRKAIMMIKDLCPGLCGSGKTILFTKKNEKWTSNTGMIWFH